MLYKVRKKTGLVEDIFFSEGDRMTLISSVLSGMPIYFFSLSRTMFSLDNILERIMRETYEGLPLRRVKGHSL